MVTTIAQLRTEYIKIILHTFDFWFLQTANTIWAIVLIWSGRFVYVAIMRLDDNALVLLRGDVEFDFDGWKKQTRVNDQ
ncbi:hypothetical protein PC117_g7180 [Phytophthora cactorum]|uniref:Transmembrane protein n=1 Tax=Phytophthora cactorum TaxID=29920 RepID=A0A8T1E5T4_9STRA|nr:hypothetical protein PC117_g7180 [Phytophthora cactorum]